MATQQIDEIAPAKSRHSPLRSFGFAFAGLRYLFQTQRNAQIELLAAIAACGLAIWLRLGPTDWAILTITIALVLILEALNTAIETVVDLAMPDVHPLAKIAKDVAAGTVLLAAFTAVIIGVLILGIPLWNRLVR